MTGLLTIEEALARILELAQPLPVETVSVAEAAGRVLREPALSRVDLPPFASSAMDGFALRSFETPGELPVVFRVAAGAPAPGPLPAGAAAGIATGGAVPDEADAVVPIEQVVDRGARVEIHTAVPSGQHIRPRGGDVREGDVVMDAGWHVGAAQIGALAAAGVAEVRCSIRPRVSVLATGSELTPAGEPLAHGQIYESNRAMIAAFLRRAGARVEVLPVVDDDESAHRAALERGLAADVLVTSGGVSMGPHDLVRKVAAELGVEEVFWGVAVKPGKPLSFGVRDTTLVFGLPGNPVSSLVGSLLFVCPALLALQGSRSVGPAYEHGRANTAIRQNQARDEFVRASRIPRSDAVYLQPVSGQESHMIVRAASADALVHVARGEGEIPAGAAVRYLTLD
ncbi:MAG TPA: gephyrin-like molybdotransferase Glp [Gaiellaceae bacterium]|nr:gephyrin-like molybdotransferase Glp [Gaiellaceae bacterium]